MFRLKSVYIKDYKNIQDQTFDFSSNTGYIALIGLNGSGKSNLLEAISIIFNGLFNKKAIPFEYEIKYDIDGHIYERKKLSAKKDGLRVKDEDMQYPSSIIACYSGEDLRLWHVAYEDYYMQYFKDAVRNKSFSPQIVYINKYCWKIAFISLLCSAKDSVKDFLKNVFSIDDIISVDIHIEADAEKREKFADHAACRWYDRIKELQDEDDHQLINARTLATTDMMIYGAQNADIAPYYVFQYLYLLALPEKNVEKGQAIDKLITDLDISINGVSFDNLSEGEKKLILIETITQILGDENSLVLLDEPDAHVHIENKKKILETITQYNGQTILTTHSPIFIDMMNQEDIRYIESGSIVNMDRIKTITKISEGRISILEGALVATAKKMIITEGPDDVKHIKAAISELSKRHLDYAKLSRIPITFQGGAKLVNEYYESIIKPVYNNLEKIIFVFDYDSEGREGAKLVEKLQLEKITYVYYYDNYPIAQNAHDFFLEDFYPRTIYPDIQLPQIQKEPTFYEMKKCSTLTNSVKSRLQKMIKDGELKGTNFDGYVNFLNQLVAIFNPLL